MKIIAAQERNLKVILKALEDGKVLVFPTDTVYGLVCDAGNEESVKRVFEIKEREKTKPLLVFVKDIGMAKKYAFINKNQEKFLKKNWPGITTVILKSKKGLSKMVYQNNTIGLRVPKCKLLNLVLERFGKPLAQTSANISGKSAIVRIKDIFDQFEKQDVQPDVIVNAGDLPVNKPSRIINLINNKVIRA